MPFDLGIGFVGCLRVSGFLLGCACDIVLIRLVFICVLCCGVFCLVCLCVGELWCIGVISVVFVCVGGLLGIDWLVLVVISVSFW